MTIVKKIFHVLLVGLLGFLTVISIAALTFSLTVTNREVAKSWPQDGDIYPKISDNLLALMQPPDDKKDESLEESIQDTPLDRDRLNSALKTVYTPDYWQTKYETLIDAFYDWLEGTDDELEFTLAFNDRNKELIRAVETELAQQLATYPRCTSLSEIGNINEFNPLEAECLPPGISPGQAAKQFADELAGDDSFLSDAVVTEDDLDLDPEFRANAPTVFNVLDALPWILAPVLLVFGTLAVLTDKSVLRGLRKTGQTLFGIGLVSWIGFYIANKLATGFEFRPREEGGDVNPDAFNDIAQPFARAVFDDLTRTGLWVSLTVVIAGTLIWLGAFIWHKVHHDRGTDTAKKAADQKVKGGLKLPQPAEPEDKK